MKRADLLVETAETGFGYPTGPNTDGRHEL